MVATGSNTRPPMNQEAVSLSERVARKLVPAALACIVFGCSGTSPSGGQNHGAAGAPAGAGGSMQLAGAGGLSGASAEAGGSGFSGAPSAGASGASGMGGAAAASGMSGASGAGAASGMAGLGASGGAGSGGAGGLVFAGPGCTVPVAADDEPMLLSQTGCVDPTDPTTAAATLVPYDVNSPLWSDGASKERYISMPPGTTIHVKDCTVEPATCQSVDDGGTGEDEGHWDLPVGAVVMKVFLVGGARIETRLLMHVSDTTWRGYSFEWNDAGTDATLLSDQKDKTVGDQSWHYPSPSECLSCHTDGAGRSLGPTTAQLNRDYTYPDGTTMNEVDKFEALGLFDRSPTRIAGYPSPSGDAPVDQRARSYLQANCSLCHRPGGTVMDVDLRFTTSFADTSLCNQSISSMQDDLTLPPLRLVPGDPADSNISFRMHSTTEGYRMPKLASSVVDPTGTALIDQWITSITSCP
jgi:hypothetical protein